MQLSDQLGIIMEKPRTRKYDKNLFKRHIEDAFDAPFKGWDFAYIAKHGGNVEDSLPWNYDRTVKEYLQSDTYLLDMGTGGGEYLSLLNPLPKNTYATECYEPNVPIAKGRLEPLGIKVVQADIGDQENAKLPFGNDIFDLIINRHEAYDSKELNRVLKSRSIFITQQVGCKNMENLRIIFNSPLVEDSIFHQKYYWDLETAIYFLKKVNLEIIRSGEYIGSTRFPDIRALVYLLKAISWDFPNFTMHEFEGQLFNIYCKIVDDGYFDVDLHRFLVIARKL